MGKSGKRFGAIQNIWLHLHKVLMQLQSKGSAKMSGAKWAATANAAYTQCRVCRAAAAAKTNWRVNKAVKLHTRGCSIQHAVCST